MLNWLRRRLPDRAELLHRRPLGRWTPYLADDRLWTLARRPLRRAIAIGFACAFLLPVGQFALAAALAVPLRANVPVAVVSTLITNPFTFPPVFVAAHWVGRQLLPAPGLDPSGWVDRIVGILGPTGLGLWVFAIAGAAIGFVLGELIWRADLGGRWRRRTRTASPSLQAKDSSDVPPHSR